MSVGFEKVWFRPLKMTCFLFIRIANKALQALQFGAPLPRRHVLLGPRSPGKRQGRLYFPGKWNLVSRKKKGYPGKLQARSRHFLKRNVLDFLLQFFLDFIITLWFICQKNGIWYYMYRCLNITTLFYFYPKRLFPFAVMAWLITMFSCSSYS